MFQWFTSLDLTAITLCHRNIFLKKYFFYIHGVFTDQPYSSPLESIVIYIPIFTFLMYLPKCPKVNHSNVK